MKVDKDKMVSLVYELREGNSEGNVIEKLDESNPLRFVFGSGMLLPAFESNIVGRSTGDSFSFVLNAADAYGERREEMIIDVPSSVFMNNGRIDENICSVGNTVPMMDSSGNHLSGIILEINDQAVKMDFNHPMAGVNLCFSGMVTEVREATEDELNPSGSSCNCSGSCSTSSSKESCGCDSDEGSSCGCSGC